MKHMDHILVNYFNYILIWRHYSFHGRTTIYEDTLVEYKHSFLYLILDIKSNNTA